MKRPLPKLQWGAATVIKIEEEEFGKGVDPRVQAEGGRGRCLVLEIKWMRISRVILWLVDGWMVCACIAKQVRCACVCVVACRTYRDHTACCMQSQQCIVRVHVTNDADVTQTHAALQPT